MVKDREMIVMLSQNLRISREWVVWKGSARSSRYSMRLLMGWLDGLTAR